MIARPISRLAACCNAKAPLEAPYRGGLWFGFWPLSPAPVPDCNPQLAPVRGFLLVGPHSGRYQGLLSRAEEQRALNWQVGAAGLDPGIRTNRAIPSDKAIGPRKGAPGKRNGLKCPSALLGINRYGLPYGKTP